MCRLPGIGKKTASQIILDLKGKLVETETIDNETLNDVGDVLKQFDYKQAEIRPVLKKLEHEEGSTDELIKKALAMLVK